MTAKLRCRADVSFGKFGMGHRQCKKAATGTTTMWTDNNVYLNDVPACTTHREQMGNPMLASAPVRVMPARSAR